MPRESRPDGTSPSTPWRGPTATPLFLNGKDQATIDRRSAMAPMERLGEPRDIAEVTSSWPARLAG